MERILRYLDSQNAQVTLTINLHSETDFGEAGTPVIDAWGPHGGGPCRHPGLQPVRGDNTARAPPGPRYSPAQPLLATG